MGLGVKNEKKKKINTKKPKKFPVLKTFFLKLKDLPAASGLPIWGFF